MNKQTLKELRKLMKKQADEVEYKKRFDLYNVLGAIRGPDIREQREFKTITIAIRAYIGMDRFNCSGAYGAKGWYPQRIKDLKQRLDQLRLIKSQPNDHYIQHLKYAVRSIGRQNLMDFAQRRWGNPKFRLS